jgi:hypothetical protein
MQDQNLAGQGVTFKKRMQSAKPGRIPKPSFIKQNAGMKRKYVVPVDQ